MDRSARIGPNALLQLVPVLDQALGPAARTALFDGADVAVPPPDAGMWPEAEVVRLHRALVQTHPDHAPAVLRDAGLRTADYILAHRIPGPAKRLIRALPAPLAARLLTAAIARHAWTFTGSGHFAVERWKPLCVSITRNPLACGAGEPCGCRWHAAVFERLYSTLVWPSVKVIEIVCCARGDPACRFQIEPQV